jgi:hypothetical protein
MLSCFLGISCLNIDAKLVFPAGGDHGLSYDLQKSEFSVKSRDLEDEEELE